MNNWFAEFDPKNLKIILYWDKIKTLKKWRRQSVALFFHELTHLFDWIFVYRCKALSWNNNHILQEKKADKVQDSILKLLLCGGLNE